MSVSPIPYYSIFIIHRKILLVEGSKAFCQLHCVLQAWIR